MFFDDWEEHKNAKISKTLLWEYDTTSPDWNWQKMAKIVVMRVLERGNFDDYYAMFNLYGGKENVREIVKQIPHLHKREISWACHLFKLKREELYCLKRQQLRNQLLNS